MATTPAMNAESSAERKEQSPPSTTPPSLAILYPHPPLVFTRGRACEKHTRNIFLTLGLFG